MHLTSQSRVVLIQNRETDPQDRLRSHVEVFFKDCLISLETVVLESRDSPVSYSPDQSPDLVLILGGDGTFLRAVRAFARLDVPLVGINTGHLGFLTRIEADKVDSYLQAILAGEFSLEHRMMLAVDSEEHLALNDAVVKNSNPSRLARLNVYINGEFLADYDADGIIVSTPTGSTAYNISAGGPILDPQADVLVITPICPHSLSAKPIILPANRELAIESDWANISRLVCALDGQDAFYLNPGERFKLLKSRYQLPMVCFGAESDSFYALLKRKLGWGANPRTIVQSRIS